MWVWGSLTLTGTGRVLLLLHYLSSTPRDLRCRGARLELAPINATGIIMASPVSKSKVPEELAGTGAPTQAYQGVSKKDSEEEGETNFPPQLPCVHWLSINNILLLLASRFLICLWRLPRLWPVCRSATYGAMAHGSSPPPGAIAI